MILHGKILAIDEKTPFFDYKKRRFKMLRLGKSELLFVVFIFIARKHGVGRVIMY